MTNIFKRKRCVSPAKWSLTFGEGLDGYFAATIFSGGNSLAVFNERFFTPAFATMQTVNALDEPIAYDRCWCQGYDLLTLYITDQFRENLRAFDRGGRTLCRKTKRSGRLARTPAAFEKPSRTSVNGAPSWPHTAPVVGGEDRSPRSTRPRSSTKGKKVS
jgi:hypothetical protein